MRKTSLKFSQSSWLCKIALVVIVLMFQAMLGIGAGVLNAQTVTGTVISGSDQEPLIGASVQVQGTTVGAVTDLDGNYSIQAKNGQTLVVSYLGFITQNVKVTGDKVDIVLQEDKHSLDEVVVVGYGVQKKKLVTGANINVKGDEIAKLNTSNPLQALQGQTPGMSIISTSGQPGSGLKVNIRGRGTMSDSGPLYIIDGVRGDIASLNPADIESIDVLKDAASAAIYGSQSANGVVLITTKSGKEGRAVVSFDGYTGWQNKARSIKMLNAKEYMEIMDEAAINSGKSAYDWSSMKSIYNADGSLIDTDWVDQMFVKNAKTGSYNIGVNGGSKTASYAMTMGYMNQEGIVGGKDVSNYERYNFRVNSDWKVKDDFLKVGEQISFIYTKNKGISVGNAYNNSMRGAFNTSPLSPVYSGNNQYGVPYNDTSDSDWYNADGNPYGSMMTNSNNQTNAARFTANVYAEIQPIKNLKFRTVLGYEYYSSDYRSFTPLYKFSIYSYNTSKTTVSQSMSHNWQLTWTNTLSYDFKIKDHSLTALIGSEAYRFDGVGVGASQGTLKSGFDDWAHAYVSNGTASNTTDGLGASGAPSLAQRMMSYFGRLSWNWKETYMATATLRADASSKFAKGHRWGYFPSISGGWIVTNESFAKSWNKIIDYAKIRASWGQVGNQNIGDLMFVSPITTSNTYYNFGTTLGPTAQSNYYGAYESRLPNENVKWETSEQLDFGIDLRFFGKLNANIDWYKKTTKDWLVVTPLPGTAGTGEPYTNGGDVKNTGIEIGLGWNDHIGKDFNYYINVNGAYNKNKVGNINTNDGIIHGTDGKGQLYDNSTEFYRASNGEPIGYFWGYKTAGIFQNQQEIDDWVAAGNGVLQGKDVKPGDVKYFDINHDGKIDDNDKVNLGNGMPDFTYGFSFGFDYKGFDFGVTANGSVGNDIVQAYRGMTNAKANYTSAILKRWTGEGTSNSIPRVTETNINYQFSDLFIQDGDFLRISNITLGYDFSKILKQAWISQARLYFQVQNAFTFTKYDGMDPEIGYGVNSWASGIDLGYYPRPRTFLVGLNLKF